MCAGDSPELETPWAVEMTGRHAVLGALAQPSNSWTRLRTETTTVLACGPVVLVEQVSTLVDDAGAQVVKPVAHVFTVLDQRVTEIRTYRKDLRRS